MDENDINSPGWDAIDAVFDRLYPNAQNPFQPGSNGPLHFGTLISWDLGGNDPLEGISVYDAGDFWHFVTYGLSELFEKETENPEISGCGFELTLKLKKSGDMDADYREIQCIAGILQSIARLTFDEGEIFQPGEYIYTGQTQGIDAAASSALTGFITALDEAGEIDTPNGHLQFVELIGVTDAELKAIIDKKLSVRELYKRVGDLTDYARPSMEDASGSDDTPEDEDDTSDGEDGSEYAPELYDEEQLNAVEQHIETYFGEYETVFHELVSPDIHVDICLIPPREGRDYYTLVTMGMGAHEMDVPKELRENKLSRAELLINLPPDWELTQEAMRDERWYWPIRLLKSLARLPIREESWLGWGHTVQQEGGAYAESTELCCALLICPGSFGQDSFVCPLPDGDEVNFYQIVPLHREEMDFKLQYGADELLRFFPREALDVLDPGRNRFVTEELLALYRDTVDALDIYTDLIQREELPLTYLHAASHMAALLRWAIRRGSVSKAFEAAHGKIATLVRKGKPVDLESYIRLRLNGRLLKSFFTDDAASFAADYCADGLDSKYAGDLEHMARERFGGERYDSGEFHGAAFLFLPPNDRYFDDVEALLEQRFNEFNSGNSLGTRT